jgi:hypothetical protein
MAPAWNFHVVRQAERPMKRYAMHKLVADVSRLGAEERRLIPEANPNSQVI